MRCFNLRTRKIETPYHAPPYIAKNAHQPKGSKFPYNPTCIEHTLFLKVMTLVQETTSFFTFNILNAKKGA